MELIFIYRDGREYGPYSSQDIRDFIESGHTSLDDHARIHTATEWTTVRNVFKSVDKSPLVLAPRKKAIIIKQKQNGLWILVVIFVLIIFGEMSIGVPNGKPKLGTVYTVSISHLAYNEWHSSSEALDQVRDKTYPGIDEQETATINAQKALFLRAEMMGGGFPLNLGERVKIIDYVGDKDDGGAKVELLDRDDETAYILLEDIPNATTLPAQ